MGGGEAQGSVDSSPVWSLIMIAEVYFPVYDYTCETVII